MLPPVNIRIFGKGLTEGCYRRGCVGGMTGGHCRWSTHIYINVSTGCSGSLEAIASFGLRVRVVHLTPCFLSTLSRNRPFPLFDSVSKCCFLFFWNRRKKHRRISIPRGHKGVPGAFFKKTTKSIGYIWKSRLNPSTTVAL